MTCIHCRWGLTLAVFTACLAFNSAVHADSAPAQPQADSVRAWAEDVVIPTYAAGEPEPNPMFYFGRNSQGAQGRVYPYPLYDSLTNVKADKTYHEVFLENQYVRIGILPEIGGRLFEAVDKSNHYDFIYHQHVIKPALIGLIGAWISGGIEWNIPHHHRATTFLPVQSKMVDNADGSKTIWVGELEIRQRMNWAVGYTLHPGKSYLECQVRIINGTPVANSMLCFANVAVHVDDDYQVIFPPSTQYVTFHGKRDFTTWPIATTRFNGVDFTRGVNVSWYKNHQSANSMFAWNYTDDFFAGYDHGKQAGIVSVADHEVVPGKKFWTWGNGPRGKMWDKILTDDDGPYIELMAGAYSDNQPDYSWLAPYETKMFQMNWYPLRDIGGVKKANLDAAVNLEVTGHDATTAVAASAYKAAAVSPYKAATVGRAEPPTDTISTDDQSRARQQTAGAQNGARQKTLKLGFCTTAAHPDAKVLLTAGDKTLLEEKISIDPTKPFVKEIAIPADMDEHDLRASLSADNRELIAYSPVRLLPTVMPEPVTPPGPSKSIKTVEELYLAGQRIEQFNAPGQEPEPYWEEALARDPGDSQTNIALGIRQLKQAKFPEAEQHFRTALARLTKNYTSPKNGEPFYYLGVALVGQEKYDEAYDAFSKATWSQAWRGPAYFGAAQIDCRRGDFAKAMDDVNRSLDANDLNVPALALKSAVLRHLGRPEEALAVVEDGLHKIDPLDERLMTEHWLAATQAIKNLHGPAMHDQLAPTAVVFNDLKAAFLEHPAAALEAAVAYGDAGLWEDGGIALGLLIATADDKHRIPPLTYYYAAQFCQAAGKTDLAEDSWKQAAKLSPEYAFPFQWEAIAALRSAIKANPNDARAQYYLGNLLFDWQPDEAVKLWQQSEKLDPSFAIVHRNLAAAYTHQKSKPDMEKAIAELEQAVACQKKYALHFTELDELYAAKGTPPEKRLALLVQNHEVVAQRDDALSREIGLLVFAGKYDEAIQLMTGRVFSVWEGGTLDVAEHWVNAHLLRGRRELEAQHWQAAVDDFQAAKNIPSNLPNDRGAGGNRQAEIAYWTGVAYDGLGNADAATQAWQAATNATAAPADFRRRGEGRISDRQVQIYYQALAKRKLEQAADADKMLHNLIETAQTALDHGDEQPATAETFGPRLSPQARAALAHTIAGLGHLGLGEKDLAQADFEKALQAMPDSLLAHTELAALKEKAGQ
ncbi:MAG TPA: DUF5107 domain-containing protein [Pirellulales bacterium]|nr:DUF5107 domain-containing protein [Pirellulales bacterium]